MAYWQFLLSRQSPGTSQTNSLNCFTKCSVSPAIKPQLMSCSDFTLDWPSNDPSLSPRVSCVRHDRGLIDAVRREQSDFIRLTHQSEQKPAIFNEFTTLYWPIQFTWKPKCKNPTANQVLNWISFHLNWSICIICKHFTEEMDVEHTQSICG